MTKPVNNSSLGGIDMATLKRMRFVARMKDKADAMGVPFIGGYIDEETGEMFMQTNIEDRDMVEEVLKNDLLPSD